MDIFCFYFYWRLRDVYLPLKKLSPKEYWWCKRKRSSQWAGTSARTRGPSAAIATSCRSQGRWSRERRPPQNTTGSPLHKNKPDISERKVFLRSVRRLLVTVNVVPSTPNLVTLMMDELSSSETSILTTSARRNMPEDTILHSHRHENLKSYRAFTGWSL
jgi:hypothetical protein